MAVEVENSKKEGGGRGRDTNRDKARRLFGPML